MEIGCSNGISKRMHSPSSVDKQVEFDNNPKHSSKGASFIKLLGPDFSKQMHIPHDFTVIFNGYIPHRFIIESAMTKECWRVQVEEEGDGTIYFREGWTDFVEANSLQVGDILVFEYEEQPIFQVKIYDRNGCLKMAEDAQGGKQNPLKIINYDEEEEGEASEIEPKKFGTNYLHQPKTKRLSTRKYGSTTYKKNPAIPRTYIRTSTVSMMGNNMAFSVKIHKYKTHQFYHLTIPMAISLAKDLASKDEVILEDATGNRWPVKVSHRSDGRTYLSSGWSDFFKHIEGAAGDMLSFEFISDGLARVLVMKPSRVEQKSEDTRIGERATHEPNTDYEVDDQDDQDACTADVNPADASISPKKGRKRDSSELSSSSSFTFLWRPTTSGVYLHVPKVIIEGQKLRSKDNVMLRDPDGKCWPLQVSIRRDGRVALTKGWVEFWKGHDIKAGDSLDFEFVSDDLIQVNINRGKPPKSPIQIDEATIDVLISDDEDEPAMQPETALTRAERCSTRRIRFQLGN